MVQNDGPWSSIPLSYAEVEISKMPRRKEHDGKLNGRKKQF